jgi:nucleoside-diphosphate-sugar epimerase
VLGNRYGVPVTVLQPTVVYGPFAGVYGTDILQELRSGQPLLVDGGAGICNAVYVDDLVTAMTLAATRERAVGERILVSGFEHPTWRQFFAAFEQMLGVHRTVSMSEGDALDLWHRSRRRRWLLPELLRAVTQDTTSRQRLLATREGHAIRQVVERMLPGLVTRARSALREQTLAPGTSSAGELAPVPLRPWLLHYLAKRCRVRIEKARELLGYQPVFGLEDGMRLTQLWARWAGHLS